MRSGTEHLRIASVIEIFLGIGSILFTYLLIGAGDGIAPGLVPEQVSRLVALTYGAYAFQAVAGVLGLCLSDRRSAFTVLLGVLLFGSQLILFLRMPYSIPLILINAALLAVAYLYLHGAYQNFRA